MNTAQEMSELILQMHQRATNGMVPQTFVAEVLTAACAAIADLDARVADLEQKQ